MQAIGKVSKVLFVVIVIFLDLSVGRVLASDEPTLDDLRRTMECDWAILNSPEPADPYDYVNDENDDLVKLAASLDYDPVSIYNWVYHNVYFPQFLYDEGGYWYYYYKHSRLGARGSYLSKVGNHWDQSSLLIALLRISKVPARYVKMDNNDLVYVEAWIELDNYYGAQGGSQKGWVPLVPWLKDINLVEGYDLFRDVADFENDPPPPGLDFDFTGYLSSIKYQSALELYKNNVQDYLKVNHPGKTLKDIPFKEVLIDRTTSLLPRSLPSKFISGNRTRFSEVPEDNREHIQLFIKKTDETDLIDYILYVPKIAGKKFCLDWIYSGAGLTPVFKIDGQIVETGSQSITAEESIKLSYRIKDSNKTVTRPERVAGTYIHMGFDPYSASPKTIEKAKQALQTVDGSLVLDPNTHEEYLGLMGTVLVETFLHRLYENSKQAARYFYGAQSWSLCPVFIYSKPHSEENPILTDAESKFYYHPQWNIDAQSSGGLYKRNSANNTILFPSWDAPINQTYRWLYGYGASYDEGRIFEDWMDTLGASTIKGLMVANEDLNNTGNRMIELVESDIDETPTALTSNFDNLTVTTDHENNIFSISPYEAYDGFHIYGFRIPDGWSYSGFPLDGDAVDGSHALMAWGGETTILRGSKFDLTSFKASALLDGAQYNFKGYRGSNSGYSYSKTITANKAPHTEHFGWTDLNRVVITPVTNDKGPVILDNMAYIRKEYITEIEDQTKWHLGYQSVMSLIDQLRNDGRVITPIQQVYYAELSGDIRIVHSPGSDLYSFGMDNGGAASPYTYYDPAPVNLNNYDYDPTIYDTPTYLDWEADYSTTINNTSTTYTIPSNASNAQVYTLGDPVDMVKGEFYTEENPDFRIKSRGFELSVIRKYKSRQIYNGPFGFGWTWNHAERIMPLENDGVIYHNNDGVSFEITYENNKYVYPKGSRFKLEKLADGYKITQNQSRIKSFFSSKGYLIRKEDPYGNKLEYEYTDPDFTNRITKIRDVLDRYLSFDYNANGKVKKITDFTGRYCTYGYGPDDDPANPDRKDNLVAFTDLEGNLTRYQYLYGQENEFNNHNMSKYILPNGDWLEIGYYRNDQAAYHTNKKGETFHFMYSRLNRYAETWNEEGYYRKVFFNENNDVTRVLNEDGTVERMAYDEYHNKINHTDANGYTTHFTYCPDKADGSSCLPDLATGAYFESDGAIAAKRNLYTKTNELGEKWAYKYESDHNAHAPTEVKDPEGRTVSYSYTPEGSLDITTNGPGLNVTGDGEIVTGTGLKTDYDYDPFGNLTKVTYPDSTTKQKFYHIPGGRHPEGLYLLYELDGEGNKTTYDYYDLNDPDGILVGPDTMDTQGMPVQGMPVSTLKSVEIESPAEPGDIKTYYRYNHYNQITEVTDAIGGITRLEYDENRQLRKKINANGAATTYAYYSARDIVSGAKVKRIIDPLLNRQYFEYDQLGNVILKEDKNGNITRYFYDEMNRLREEIDPFQNSIHYAYDGNGNLISKTDKNGNETFFEYDAANRLLKKTDPEGKIIEYEYYRDGKIKNEKYAVNTTSPISVVTHYEYDALGRLETATIGDATNGYEPFVCSDCRTSQYRYDALGRLKRTIFPLGNYEVNEYDGNGNKIKVTNYDRNVAQLRQTEYAYYPDSRNLLKEVVVDNGIDGLPATGDGHWYEYDALGRMVAEIDPEGNTVEYEYDSVGNLRFEIDVVGNITEHAYDDANRKVQTIDAENKKMIFRYDDNGNLVSVIDREGNETLTYYDALNRKSDIQDPSGAWTSFDYDANGNVIAVKDPNGGVAYYEFDGNNRLKRKVRPMGEETTYAYDPVGNQTEIIDEKNQKITYAYDRYSLLKEAKYYNATAPDPVKTVNFLYDDNGNMESYDDGTVSATFTYDDLNRKLSETIHYPTFSKGFAYAYPSYWQRAFTDSDKVTVRYNYDSALRLTSVDIPGAGQVTVNAYHGYAPAEVSLPGGTMTNTYDPLMRVKTILSQDPSGIEVMRRDYTYSLEGNIIEKITEYGDYHYQYDAMFRLTSATNPTSRDESYRYDDLGNRVISANETIAWNYNANNELESYDANISFQYDGNGNTTQKTAAGVNETYVYDVSDRLIEIRDHSGAPIATYYYDPFGRRLWKDVGGVKVYYLYSDEGLIAEFDATGTELRSYGYKPGSEWTTDPLYVKENNTYYWYQNDHLGTPQKITNSAGTVVWAATYDSFGNVQITTSDIVNNLRFPGQYYDDETGLCYNWNRYYDPEMGRYLRTDPVGDGLNLYIYVYNNPLLFYDAEGLIARDIYDWGSSGVSSWYDANFTSQGFGPSGQPYAPTMNYLGSDQPLLYRALQNSLVAPLYNMAAETWNAGWRVQSGHFSEADLLSTVLLAAPGSQAVAPALEYGSIKAISSIGRAGTYVDDFIRSLDDGISMLRNETGSIGYDFAPNRTVRDASGKLRNADGTFAYDGGPKIVSKNPTHGNTKTPDTQATLYGKFDKDDNFLKWGKSQVPNTRYTSTELAGGYVKPYRIGPTDQILDRERRLIERFPGPENNEQWAGWTNPSHPNYRGKK